jgi:hypothetical protein
LSNTYFAVKKFLQIPYLDVMSAFYLKKAAEGQAFWIRLYPFVALGSKLYQGQQHYRRLAGVGK